MKKIKVPFLILTYLVTAGCASVTQSDSQSVAISASYLDKPVDADCKLTNDRGAWDAKAPAMVSVRKSGEDLNVTCKKEGMPDGLIKAVSRAAGSMFGNILIGGGIGAMIDHSSGKGYNYPDQLPVKMGESTVVDKREKPQPNQSVQSSSTSKSPFQKD